MENVPFKDLLEAASLKVKAMGDDKLAKNLRYCVNLQELTSCLREYIFRSDAKTDAFLKDLKAEVGASLGLVAIRGEEVLAKAQDQLKQALTPALVNLKLGQRGKLHLDNYLQAVIQQAATNIQQLVENAKRLDTDTQVAAPSLATK